MGALPFKLPKGQLGPRYRALAGLTGALVALVLAARFLYVPALARLSRQRAALQDLTVKIADAHVLTEQLPQQQAALEEAQQRHRAMFGRVGEGQSVARILEQLSALAKSQRVELAAVQPRADEEPRLIAMRPGLAMREIPLRLQLKGRYQQIGEFLGRFPTAPFMASVKQLAMRKPEAETAQLEADVLIGIYVAEQASGRGAEL
jgi:Tfp pilus assembly protein PilO